MRVIMPSKYLPSSVIVILTAAAALAIASPLPAAAVFTTTYEEFIAAAPEAELEATFESEVFGPIGPVTEGGVHFSSPLSNLYIIDDTVGTGNCNPLPTSNMLTGNGDDEIDMTFLSRTRLATPHAER